MIGVGDAFKCRCDPFHLYFVISTPDEDGNAVIVNLTTLRNDVEDDSCVLKNADYPDYISRPSMIMFRKAHGVNVSCFQVVANWSPFPALPTATLIKIQQAALASDYLRRRYRDIIRTEIEE